MGGSPIHWSRCWPDAVRWFATSVHTSHVPSCAQYATSVQFSPRPCIVLTRPIARARHNSIYEAFVPIIRRSARACRKSCPRWKTADCDIFVRAPRNDPIVEHLPRSHCVRQWESAVLYTRRDGRNPVRRRKAQRWSEGELRRGFIGESNKEDLWTLTQTFFVARLEMY